MSNNNDVIKSFSMFHRKHLETSKIVVAGNNKACCLSSCRHVYRATALLHAPATQTHFGKTNLM